MIFSSNKRKFLFKCDDCSMIIDVELEEDDIEKVQADEMVLGCPCGGHCLILRD